MAGLLLAKMGIPSRVIERDMVPSPLSKAIGIHARTIELIKMTDANLFEQFGSQSWRSESMRFYFGGSLVADIKPKPSKDSEFHVPWMLEQTRTVQILTEEYEKTGMGRVERGWELLDTKVVEREQVEEKLAEDGSTKSTAAMTSSWVETTVRRAVEGNNKRTGESVALGTVDMAGEDEGKEYEVKVINSEYLIGSDGGRSTVRHRLNIPFPGRTRDYNLILFDGCVETNLSTSNISFIQGDNCHSIGVFPIRENRVRMMIDDGIITQEAFDAREIKVPNKDFFENLLQKTLGPLKVKVLSYNWLTYYRVNERRATEFAHKRRIFLAGDAAHCHSPAGGQGLNTGVQDSYNLAWKIAMVLNGTAPQSLLDTYTEERIPIADEIIAFSAKLLESGRYQGVVKSTIKRLMLTIMPFLSRFFPAAGARQPFNMLGLRYHENSLNKVHKSQPYPAKGPASIGERGPDDILTPLSAAPTTTIEQSESLAELEGDSIGQPTATRLYELLAFPCAFHIIVFTADRLLLEKDFDAGLSKNIEHYQGSWLSKWPGVGGKGLSAEALMARKTSTPQFLVHVISSKDLSESHSRDIMASRTLGFGKIFQDVEGGRLHERYGIEATKKGGIVVLRPDTHIAFRVSNVESAAWADVDEYFGSILTVAS
ncbi:MAG: FAD binding domain-containing protein [Linnemannia gamsii]|nr:MAG: FAD binding domain-containing protein [Linnemannia gamsii]